MIQMGSLLCTYCIHISYVTQELLSQAATRQPDLLQHLRLTLEQMAADQSSTMGQLLRDGPKAESAASAAVLQVIAGVKSAVQPDAVCLLTVGDPVLLGSEGTRGMPLQGFTMLAELKRADGSGADLIPEALKSSLPDR